MSFEYIIPSQNILPELSASPKAWNPEATYSVIIRGNYAVEIAGEQFPISHPLASSSTLTQSQFDKLSIDKKNKIVRDFFRQATNDELIIEALQATAHPEGITGGGSIYINLAHLFAIATDASPGIALFPLVNPNGISHLSTFRKQPDGSITVSTTTKCCLQIITLEDTINIGANPDAPAVTIEATYHYRNAKDGLHIDREATVRFSEEAHLFLQQKLDLYRRSREDTTIRIPDSPISEADRSTRQLVRFDDALIALLSPETQQIISILCQLAQSLRESTPPPSPPVDMPSGSDIELLIIGESSLEDEAQATLDSIAKKLITAIGHQPFDPEAIINDVAQRIHQESPLEIDVTLCLEYTLSALRKIASVRKQSEKERKPSWFLATLSFLSAGKDPAATSKYHQKRRKEQRKKSPR